MRNVNINMRCEPELRKNIVEAAHAQGRSMAELVLWATCSYLINHNLALYDEFEKLEKEMSPGAQREKVANLRHEAAVKAEYWGRQAMTVEENGRSYEVRGAAERYMQKVETGEPVKT